MNLKNFDRVYFIGIGGIGMSALARFFLSKNYRVAGYDKTSSSITKALTKEGAKIHYKDGISNIPKEFRDIENTLVVYTPAIPDNHEEYQYYKSNGFDLYKRARILAEIANAGRSYAVAGTHGKTTTSSLLAHLLKDSGIDVNAFLGGISWNYNTNFLVGKAKEVVIEADEFDRSFHYLKPEVGLITSMDPDHLDIYGDESGIVESFNEFGTNVRKSGRLVKQVDLNIEADFTYGIESDADFVGRDIRVEDGSFVFDLMAQKKRVLSGIRFPLPGRHNIENAVGASALAHLAGVHWTHIQKGLESFKGVYRRFNIHFKSPERVYIDDYAHHPTELTAAISAARELFPSKQVTVVFQPHLFSRTKDFGLEFAQALDLADQVYLLPIYPAREEPIEGITSDWLVSMMEDVEGSVLEKEELIKLMKEERPEMVLTLGAGDIDRLVEPIKTALLHGK